MRLCELRAMYSPRLQPASTSLRRSFHFKRMAATAKTAGYLHLRRPDRPAIVPRPLLIRTPFVGYWTSLLGNIVDRETFLLAGLRQVPGEASSDWSSTSQTYNLWIRVQFLSNFHSRDSYQADGEGREILLDGREGAGRRASRNGLRAGAGR